MKKVERWLGGYVLDLLPKRRGSNTRGYSDIARVSHPNPFYKVTVSASREHLPLCDNGMLFYRKSKKGHI